MSIRQIASAMLFVMGIAPASAETGPTIRWLESTPVSMLDFGLFRISNMMNTWSGDHPLANAMKSATYDDGSGKILLNVHFPRAEFSKQLCSAVIDVVRDEGWHMQVMRDNGFTSNYGNMFHTTYKKPGEPSDLKDRVDELIEIHVWYGGRLCYGDLLDSGYSVLER